MSKTTLFILLAGMLMMSGCKDSENKSGIKTDPTFLPGCFREEVVSDTFSVPDMKTPNVAAYIQQNLRALPGFVDSRADLSRNTITVSYYSTVIRKMNIERTISLAGYAVNNRPADPQAKIPAGVE